VKRGLAWKATAWAPTTRYLTPFPFKHANHSSKSFVGQSFHLEPGAPQVVDRGYALVRGELSPEFVVGCRLVSVRIQLAQPGAGHQAMLSRCAPESSVRAVAPQSLAIAAVGLYCDHFAASERSRKRRVRRSIAVARKAGAVGAGERSRRLFSGYDGGSA